MSKTRLLLAALAVGGALIATMTASAQESGRIEGTVTLASSGDALHGARVLIINLGRSVLTDEAGHYTFEGVPAGEHDLLATREHLQAARVLVTVADGEMAAVDFALALAAVHEEVTVTATGRETTAFDAFNNVQVLDSVDLAQNMAGNLGELLENEPGMAKRSFGPGSSRPIIRGFDNDRVLIMQDGVRTGDLSSQSGDHGVSVDPGGLQKVEILKGPATLLYGSSAIGGVVNTISPQQQFYEDPPDELRGQVNGDLGSTNEQAGGGANFQYGNGRFMTWFGGGGRRTGSYDTPEGKVENSQTEQVNGRFGVGLFGNTSYLSAGYQIEDGSYGVPFAGETTGEPEERVFIDLETRRQVARIEGGVRRLDSPAVESVKATFSYIDWYHQEVENFVATGEREVGTQFFNKTYIGRVEVQQSPTGRTSGQFGIWAQHRDYTVLGEEALSPPTQQDAFAAFAYEEVQLDRLSLQFGARLEHTRYQPEERASTAPEGPVEPGEVRDRDFTGLSGSVGLRVPFSGSRAAVVANFTSAYRAPSLEELYNFGAHPGTLSFEVGNPDLERERSSGGEVSLRINNDRIHGQASFFYYGISDFMFGAPQGAEIDGLQVIEFQQGNSRFVGADLALSFHFSNQWRVHLGGGIVDARLTETNEPLPRIPASSGRLALDWLPTNALQVRPEMILRAKQNKVFGEETPTDGATVLNLSASYTVAKAKTMHIFTLKGTNLTDVLYRNHSSFIKDVAPETGRRVLITYALRLF